VYHCSTPMEWQQRMACHPLELWSMSQHVNLAITVCVRQQKYNDRKHAKYIIYTIFSHITQLYATSTRSMHRRSQDFVWGVHFFRQKVDDLFLSSPSKDCLKLLNITHPEKCPRNSCSALGVHFVSWGVHLHIFPVTYA